MLARIAAAPVLEAPFPHCVIDQVFPAEFFEDIVDHWPDGSSFRSIVQTARVIGDAYRARMVVRLEEGDLARLEERARRFWSETVGSWLLDDGFAHALTEKFRDALLASGHYPAQGVSADALIVADRTDYAIGPHTDAPHRVVSALFYLPEDAAFRRFGTSLYQPLDGDFRCRGGPHHPFKRFRRVKTIEFVPNRLLLFPKSDRCFHGVERVDLPGIERRLLIYDVRRKA